MSPSSAVLPRESDGQPFSFCDLTRLLDPSYPFTSGTTMSGTTTISTAKYEASALPEIRNPPCPFPSGRGHPF